VLAVRRRLAPLLLAAMLVAPSAVPAAAATAVPAGDPAMLKAGADLATLTNDQRTKAGLVILRVDPALATIARDRADVMAATDRMSHTEPDGANVFDRIDEAGLAWYGAGEIIAWNAYPEKYSTAEAIRAWMASPGHHAIMVSTGYNYVGFGAAISSSGKRYYAGVFAKRPDHTGPWARFGSVAMTTVDATHKRVTVHWTGADTKLQVLTSGFYRFDIQYRSGGGAWTHWATTGIPSRTITLVRGVAYQFRLRSRDNAGNLGPWMFTTLTP
jgi:uncharacterized protein YkwD